MATSTSYLLSASGAVAGVSRSYLTAAGGSGNRTSRSFLTRARGSAAAQSVVDAGPAQIVEPFTKVTISAVVLLPQGISPKSWTFQQVGGAPTVAFVQNGYSITFEAPATIAGTLLTFRATADFDDYPDSSDTVTVDVRSHPEWMPIGQNRWVAVYESFDPADVYETQLYPSEDLYPSDDLYPV